MTVEVTNRSIGTTGHATELYLQIVRDEIEGHSIIHKFGSDPAVDAVSYTPVSTGAIYRTPQVGSATTVRVKAGNANDTADGTGAREITIIGLDETGAEVTDALATAGASVSANSINSYIRIYRAYVSKSGTYATAAAGSHAANIVIENSAGTENWLTISLNDFPRGQTEIGVYSVPLGYTAYVLSIVLDIDTNQAAGVLMFKRENILETAAPYSGMRLVLELGGAIAGEHIVQPVVPIGPFPQLTDVGFMAKANASTADISVNFEILLIANE